MSYDENCCGIQNWIFSTLTCGCFTGIATVLLTLVLIDPSYINVIYNVGGTDLNILIITAVGTGIVFFANIWLALGIIRESPVFLLIWIMLMVIVWKFHLILVFCSISFSAVLAFCDIWCAIRLLILFIVQVVTLILIIMVGKHWYELCEIIYSPSNEYLPRFGTNSVRSIHRSVRMQNVSTISTRMPQILGRLER